MQQDTRALTDEKLGSYQDFERELKEAENKIYHKRYMERLRQQAQQHKKQTIFLSSKACGQSVYRFCFGGK